MKDLLNKKCIPCEGGVKPLERGDAQDYTDEVFGWVLKEDAKSISKEFKFQDFVESVDFIDRVADIAEEEGHHPDIHIFYNKVLLELSTHSIGGLSENDFIVATKINNL